MVDKTQKAPWFFDEVDKKNFCVNESHAKNEMTLNPGKRLAFCRKKDSPHTISVYYREDSHSPIRELDISYETIRKLGLKHSFKLYPTKAESNNNSTISSNQSFTQYVGAYIGQLVARSEVDALYNKKSPPITDTADIIAKLTAKSHEKSAQIMGAKREPVNLEKDNEGHLIAPKLDALKPLEQQTIDSDRPDLPPPPPIKPPKLDQPSPRSNDENNDNKQSSPKNR